MAAAHPAPIRSTGSRRCIPGGWRRRSRLRRCTPCGSTRSRRRPRSGPGTSERRWWARRSCQLLLLLIAVHREIVANIKKGKLLVRTKPKPCIRFSELTRRQEDQNQQCHDGRHSSCDVAAAHGQILGWLLLLSCLRGSASADQDHLLATYMTSA